MITCRITPQMHTNARSYCDIVCPAVLQIHPNTWHVMPFWPGSPPIKSPSFRRCCSYRHLMSLYPESLLLNSHVTYMASSVAASPRHLQAFCIRSHSLFKVSCSSWPAEMAQLTEQFNWTQFVLGDSFGNMIFSSMRCFMNDSKICSSHHLQLISSKTAGYVNIHETSTTNSFPPTSNSNSSFTSSLPSLSGGDIRWQGPVQFQLQPGHETPVLQTLVPCLQFKT